MDNHKQQCQHKYQMNQIYRSKDYDDWIADSEDGNLIEDQYDNNRDQWI